MDFYTANIPSPAPADELAAQAKSLQHYDIDFEAEDISARYPELVANPFHLILFCEVIEHIRAAPEELIADLLRITAPDGIIILSTPNAMERGHLWELFVGKKPDTVFSKSKRFLHMDHHAHVREFTLKELEEAVVTAGGRVVVQGVRDYYSDITDVVRARFVSARHVQTLLVTRAQ
jgi:2-polyprenyl-3-methyl-5-hydroxy-6-metoxy-1,4-benzoquinol methylase